MGSLRKSYYTIPMPKNAAVAGKKVSWTYRGKKKTGTKTDGGRVRCLTETWTIEYTDETGKTVRQSTKSKSKEIAQRILFAKETEIDKIRAGIFTRAELKKSATKATPISQYIDLYRQRKISQGNTPKFINGAVSYVAAFLAEIKAEHLSDITQIAAEKWIANKLEAGVLSRRTINTYISYSKTFLNWLVETDILQNNPLAKIKKLNEQIDRRKIRRALTNDEVERLLAAAATRRYRKKGKAEEIVLVYRLLIGTGLRSMELALAVPSQFDFERNRFTVDPNKTKNKRGGILPLHPDLSAMLKSWIEKNSIQPNQRIFGYDVNSIRKSFYGDLAAAGIERKSEDGRSLDVHSLRKTFGTMLARAGVPLTTTQRLMRHSTPELTARLYIDVDPIDLSNAVEKIPVFNHINVK